MANEMVLRPSYWASVSGGKDSLYMLNLILHNLNRYKLDGVVHFELEIDYPFIKNVIDYMESECKRFGIPFVRIKPRKTWKELYDKYGFPSRWSRWCNGEYKMDAQKQLKEFLQQQGGRLISYIGYCVDETKRYKDRKNKDEIYPLVENNIFEKDILEWAKTQPIYNDYYKFNTRCGCMFCPMISMRTMAYLLKYYPEKYEEFISLASATEKKYEQDNQREISLFTGNPKYNVEYRDYIVRTKWLPILENEINNPTKQLRFNFDSGE